MAVVIPAPSRHYSTFQAALLLGIAYWPASHLLPDGPGLIAWKGAGVGLLALWAVRRAVTREGWLIAAVLACGAVGDVAIDSIGLSAGAGAFLLGHVIAIWLYTRQVRAKEDGTGVAILVLVGVPVIAFGLSGRIEVLVYALGLGTMAATAWISRYPRRFVGAGALLFVVSDLLIFARLGPLRDSVVPDLLVWPLYFAGQALIAYCVVTTSAGGRAKRG